MLTAAAVASPEYFWMGWISLLPLLWVVRVLPAAPAAFCGAFWGEWLYVFAAYAANIISPGFDTFLLLAAVPAIYAGLGSWLTRRAGFQPMLLALGWVVVEFALQPIGLRYGLLAATQGESGHAGWVARMMGYAFVAFLVVYLNAFLLIVLSSADLAVLHSRAFGSASKATRRRLPRRAPFAIQLTRLCPMQPRAPPCQAGLP
jgi:apolipoprotein N-acyltransferase